MTDTVSLNKLVISPRNVRKTNGEEDIASLAESIKSKGLLQNLVVSSSPDGKLYEVDAGGRRLRALQLLASRKDLPKNWPVPVKVIAPDAATESSLAENLQKIAMNPADEVEAFATIVEGYGANGMANPAERIANCARRFGVTERHVAQRLALAALAPDILDALRDGGITIAAATAYASHPEHAEQLKVFKAHQKRSGTYGKHDPREIRDALKGRIYPVDHKLVRYVGLDAYRDAGGEVAADLFFEDEDREILLNPALVDRLAAEKGAIEAQRLGQAEGWSDGHLAPVNSHAWSTPTAPKGFTSRWVSGSEIPADRRADGIAIYRIDDEARLVLDSRFAFFRVPETAEGEEAAPRYKPETAEERSAREREEAIRGKAFKLATPSTAGTALEGKLFWPTDSYWDVEEDGKDESILVSWIEIRIPRAEIEAQLEEAERRYDLELQELAEEVAALAAEAEADANPDDEGRDDDEDTDPNVNDAAEAEPEPADA